jgi:FKBP-type peptidyl-prolyl cis-trans isomerase FkpA
VVLLHLNNTASPHEDAMIRKFALPVLLVGALLGTTACNPYDPASRGAGGALIGAGSGAALGAIVAQRTPLAQASLDEAELTEVMSGFMDATLNKPLKVQTQELMPKVDQFLRERQKERGEKEKSKGATYLEEQARAPGAKKTASGLIYFETQAGTGAQPTPADTVKVHYKGTLIDGKEFDSSYKRGTPAEFPLGGVIKCWTEGVAMMKVGGKAKLVCPSDIAYGERGAGGSIPPNSVLNFEVELIGIVGK